MPRANKEDAELNKEIGARIAHRRKELGMSGSVLASHIGVTHQQLQKYENSTNRISACKLPAICKALKINIEDLFDNNYINPQETINLYICKNLNRIKSSAVKESIVALIRNISHEPKQRGILND